MYVHENVKKHIFVHKNLQLTYDYAIFATYFLDFDVTKSMVEVGSFLHQPLFLPSNLPDFKVTTLKKQDLFGG